MATLTTGFRKETTDHTILERFARLANSSYSLNATHVPILIMFACLLDVQVYNRWPSDVLQWGYLLGVVVSLSAFGWLFAQVTEKHTGLVRGAAK